MLASLPPSPTMEERALDLLRSTEPDTAEAALADALVYLARAGAAWTAAKADERACAEACKSLMAPLAGAVPEHVIAQYAGVDRMTVRRALGKRP